MDDAVLVVLVAVFGKFLIASEYVVLVLVGVSSEASRLRFVFNGVRIDGEVKLGASGGRDVDEGRDETWPIVAAAAGLVAEEEDRRLGCWCRALSSSAKRAVRPEVVEDTNNDGIASSFIPELSTSSVIVSSLSVPSTTTLGIASPSVARDRGRGPGFCSSFFILSLARTGKNKQEKDGREGEREREREGDVKKSKHNNTKNNNKNW